MKKFAVAVLTVALSMSAFAKGAAGGHASVSAAHVTVATPHVAVVETPHESAVVASHVPTVLKPPVASKPAAKVSTAVAKAKVDETAKVRPLPPVFVHAGKPAVASAASGASAPK